MIIFEFQSKTKIQIFHLFVHVHPVLAFGNFLGYSWTSRGRAQLVNAHKVERPEDETVVTFKQFSTEPKVEFRVPTLTEKTVISITPKLGVPSSKTHPRRWR